MRKSRPNYRDPYGLGPVLRSCVAGGIRDRYKWHCHLDDTKRGAPPPKWTTRRTLPWPGERLGAIELQIEATDGRTYTATMPASVIARAARELGLMPMERK